MSNEDTPEKEDSVPAQWPGEKTGKPGTEKTNDNGEKTVIPIVR
jgi:hypothetical protein